MVMWSRKHRTDGLVPFSYLRRSSQPCSDRIARRDAQRLTDARLIEPREHGDYFVPAAIEWPIIRKGTRDHISGFIRERVFERDGYQCVQCHSTENLTLDHIIPWSKGGEDKVSNLRTLCGSCNSSKGARV
jgi:5-methylcytosine-specific restriction endonuclease McrA